MFLIESYYANEVAANYVGRKHPNTECRKELHTFLKRMYDAVLSAKYGRNQYKSMLANRESLSKDPFVFSPAFMIILEDYGTTQFLMKELKRPVLKTDTRFISFYDMKIDDEGIPF